MQCTLSNPVGLVKMNKVLHKKSFSHVPPGPIYFSEAVGKKNIAST